MSQQKQIFVLWATQALKTVQHYTNGCLTENALKQIWVTIDMSSPSIKPVLKSPTFPRERT